ncbi:MAG: hypothetical protein SZ59_C0002G0139 [candidate division TM6 bacterium GW2011_GWF2_28_16]|nr:MAG: hypothetical protein SZ59_C0002G0139 [candidate division TM6 bacterium GW2011_GWF2_28_16]
MNNILARHVFCLIFPILFAIYIFPLLIKIANKFNILDNPDGKIKNHQMPVPYLGGVGIFIPFIATLAISYPFENQVLWLLLGITFLLFVGLVDDLKALVPLQKFAGQIIAVICFLKGGYSLKNIFFSDSLNFFISGFWMLSIINAFNLIDVMDGLTAIVSIMAGLSFFLIALYLKQYTISMLIVAFVAPIIIFFYYNKKPAKIYLGDAGSLYIGGFFAAIPQLINWSNINYIAYYTTVVILAIPVLEIFFLVLIRTFKHIPFYRPTPDHFALYLKRKGWSVQKILNFIVFVSLLLLIISFLFLLKIISLKILILLGFIFLLFWIWLIFF